MLIAYIVIACLVFVLGPIVAGAFLGPLDDLEEATTLVFMCLILAATWPILLPVLVLSLAGIQLTEFGAWAYRASHKQDAK